MEITKLLWSARKHIYMWVQENWCKLIMLAFTHVVFVKDFIDHNDYNLSLQQATLTYMAVDKM